MSMYWLRFNNQYSRGLAPCCVSASHGSNIGSRLTCTMISNKLQTLYLESNLGYEITHGKGQGNKETNNRNDIIDSRKMLELGGKWLMVSNLTFGMGCWNGGSNMR